MLTDLTPRLSYLYDAGSIFYPYYLASALTITLIWLGAKGLAPRAAFRSVLAREVWFRRSVAVDLAFCVLNLMVLRAAIKSLEDSAFTGALAFAGKAFAAQGGIGARFFASAPLEGALATLVTMLSIDLASYGMHRLMHGFEPLWKIHRLHHSAEQLTPFTTYRQHPLEPLILNGARGLASGLGLALFYRFFPHRTPVVTISGLGAGFFFYMFTVNLHHAPVAVSYPRWLRGILISPHIHHLHHSKEPRHHDSGFGVVFSIWDRIFGTYKDEEFEPGALRFGL